METGEIQETQAAAAAGQGPDLRTGPSWAPPDIYTHRCLGLVPTVTTSDCRQHRRPNLTDVINVASIHDKTMKTRFCFSSMFQHKKPHRSICHTCTHSWGPMKTQTALTSSLTLYWRKRNVTWVYGGCTRVYSWRSSTMRAKGHKVQLTFVLLGLPYPWGQKVLFSFYPILFISTFFERFWSRSSQSIQNDSVWSLRTSHRLVPKLTSFIRSQFSAKTEV